MEKTEVLMYTQKTKIKTVPVSEAVQAFLDSWNKREEVYKNLAKQ